MHFVRGTTQHDVGPLDGVRKVLAVGCETLAAGCKARLGDARLDRETQGASCGTRGPSCKVQGLAAGHKAGEERRSRGVRRVLDMDNGARGAYGMQATGLKMHVRHDYMYYPPWHVNGPFILFV